MPAVNYSLKLPNWRFSAGLCRRWRMHSALCLLKEMASLCGMEWVRCSRAVFFFFIIILTLKCCAVLCQVTFHVAFSQWMQVLPTLWSPFKMYLIISQNTWLLILRLQFLRLYSIHPPEKAVMRKQCFALNMLRAGCHWYMSSPRREKTIFHYK